MQRWRAHDCLLPSPYHEEGLWYFFSSVLPSPSQNVYPLEIRYAITPVAVDGEVAGQGGTQGCVVLSQPVVNAYLSLQNTSFPAKTGNWYITPLVQFKWG